MGWRVGVRVRGTLGMEGGSKGEGYSRDGGRE